MPDRSPAGHEPSRLIGEAVGAAILIVLGIVLLLQMFGRTPISVRDPLTPFGLPRILAGILILLGLSLFPWRLLRRRGVPSEGESTSADIVPPSGDHEMRTTNPAHYVPMLGIVGFALVLPVLGFLLSASLLGFIMIPVLGARRWPIIAIVPPATALILWFVFGNLLRVNLPSGILPF